MKILSLKSGVPRHGLPGEAQLHPQGPRRQELPRGGRERRQGEEHRGDLARLD